MDACEALAVWEDAVALAGRLRDARDKVERLRLQQEALDRHCEVVGPGYAARVLESALRMVA